ncbi:MAG: hypothetical protein AAF629_19400 [Chloroflexota bacterium]
MNIYPYLQATDRMSVYSVCQIIWQDISEVILNIWRSNYASSGDIITKRIAC